MNARPRPLPIDPGLLARFRAAGEKIAWRSVPARGKHRAAGRVRIAHLNDEEARVAVSGRGTNARVSVDAGPVGALVLLLEIDRRGVPTALGASEAGREPGFPSGAIVAAWGDAQVPDDSEPRLPDLVDLARYALA
ncbi:MAG TPA: hypothetical protein VEG42_05965 [Thermoplasmata archaeon]|nr:hypothetical protein [Thermoplasmata archaeon]HYB78816.1 hypothetical protein [Thermoplasmata archaeon]